MNIVSKSGRGTRKAAAPVIIVAALLASLPVSTVAQAQDTNNGRQSIYIDGTTPVDPRTRALVDAYFDQIENLEMAKAEERERLNRFIYHDNTFGAKQVGRW